MRRGQTTVVTMNTNVELSCYQNVVLTIEDTYPVKEKQAQVHIGANSIDGTVAVFNLDQEDTLALRAGTIKMQVRCANEGAFAPAITSNIVTTTLQDALNEEIL